LFQPCRSSSLLVTFKMSCYVSMNEIKWWWWWWWCVNLHTRCFI